MRYCDYDCNKLKRSLHTEVENKCMDTKGKGCMDWEIEVGIDTFSSVQSSHSVVSDSLQPHESQRARPPCPSPTPGVHPNSCPLSQ